MLKYEAVYFVGDNQAINRVRVDSSKTRNRGAFSGSLAALVIMSVLDNSVTLVKSRMHPMPTGWWVHCFGCVDVDV